MGFYGIVEDKIMQKTLIEGILKRYSLNGECEKAHWYSDSENETLTIKAHTETKTVILKSVLKEWRGMKTCVLALPSSTKVKSMLSPIGDEVMITLNELRDRVYSFTISDDDCESICTVADVDAFPETLDVDDDNLPNDFEVEITLTEDFVNLFLKAAASLSEAKDFVFMNNKQKKLDVVINYEDTNTNRIRIPVPTVEGKDQIFSPVGFYTPILRAIVGANAESIFVPKKKSGDGDATPAVVSPILKVTGRGMARIEFNDERYESKYLLFPTRILD